MNVYMLYNHKEDAYLSSNVIWTWAPQEEAFIFTDLKEAEYNIKFALTSRGWKLELHTFKLERI